MKNSSNRRWKGCCLMCALGRGKVKGLGRSRKDPFAVSRALGKNRRRGRNFVGDYDN